MYYGKCSLRQTKLARNLPLVHVLEVMFLPPQVMRFMQ